MLSKLFFLSVIIAGETSVCPFSAKMELARSIANRIEQGEDITDIALEFHGRGEPDTQDFLIATLVVTHALQPNRFPFVLSNEDLKTLHITREPDKHLDCIMGYGLNFFRTWPPEEIDNDPPPDQKAPPTTGKQETEPTKTLDFLRYRNLQ